MGTAAWLVWRAVGGARDRAAKPALAAILATMAAFARVDWRAVALLVPSLAWACFATDLNDRSWVRN